MARGSEVIVVVRTDNIIGMMNPHGQIGRWMGRRAQEITLRSRANVNNRTGELAASIHSTGVHHDLPFSAHFETRAGANHGLYVHEGTMMVAPIRSKRKGYIVIMTVRGPRRVKHKMVVRPFPHSDYERPTARSRVAGQHANAFLFDGMASALKGEVAGGVFFLPR